MAAGTFVLLLVAAVCRCQPELGSEGPLHGDVAVAELVREGRDQYRQAVERISMPQSGTCWKQAVAALTDGCRQLDEKTHGELALRFSDCFLELSGLEKHNCQFEDKECLRQLDQTAFDTYSKFYIHTQSMCYFLYNQAWHQETEKTIARLTTTSSKMSQQLQESAEVQSRMLSDLLTVSTVVGQVSALLLGFQRLLLSGSSFLGTVLFFAAAAVALAALCRTRSASSVVPHVFAVLFAGAITETVITNWLVDDAEAHYQWVWFLRCFETILCTVLLAYAAWRYERYGPANMKLLKNIEHKIERVLVAILKVGEPSQSTCVKCVHDSGMHSDKAYYNISEKKDSKLPGIYERNKREYSEDKPSIFSQSSRGSFLLRQTPAAAEGPFATRWTTTESTGPTETRYSREPSMLRRSPTPFLDAQQVLATPSPPPPYDYADSKQKTTEDATAPLTRRDFYTPDREVESSKEVKKAVVRIEPLKLQVSSPAAQPTRRQTPTRKVRQARNDSEQRDQQSSSEYSLRSHRRDTGSIP